MRPLSECDCPPDEDDEPGQPEDDGEDEFDVGGEG
jgi:hypothetical protein